VLTFFEYLRQRSYESVVDGVRDALESLEKEPYSSQFQEAAQQKGKTAGATLQRVTTSEENSDKKQLGTVNGESDAVPAPRRRGRPRKMNRDS
jgi:hypothetical protein